MFGVLPNYGTVERDQVPPITTGQRFHIAMLNSFDPFVYPFVAFTAGLADIEGQEPSWQHGAGGYARHYAAAFADNTIGNMMTTAIVPMIARQDPRYFVLGEGGFWRRAGYAASRSVVTRGNKGGRYFNISEIGGNFAAAGIANAYYPPSNRTTSQTLERASMQIVWDTTANELKEFWPSIRQMLHRAH